MITITHTHEDGTLVHGTSKGDGVYELIGPRSAARFRYFPSIRMIGIPQSRDHLAKRWQIDMARKALEAAGHEVTVEIDDTPRDVTEVKADRAERLDDRKAALEAKAERNISEADARFQRAHEIALGRNGQPRLANHYSVKAWDADQKRIENNDRLGADAYHEGKRAEYAASRVGREEARRERPDVIIRRIKKNEADLRKVSDPLTAQNLENIERVMGAGGAERATAEREARRVFLETQLEADRAALQAHEAAGYRCHSPQTVHVGDVIDTGRGSWGCGEVARVNPKTVSVKTEYSWTDKVSYEEIRRVICTHEQAAS